MDCGDGHSESYTVAPGTFIALSQSEADHQAFAFACLLAQILCSGPATTYTNTEQSCTVTCPNGSTYTYTVAAGLFTALDQADANTNAAAFACTLATLLCSGMPPIPLGGDPRPNPVNPLWANSPQSCGYVCPDGSISTYTVRAGLFVKESLAAANSAANSYACQQAIRHRVCMGDIPSTACAEALYTALISVTNITEPATWSIVSGSLPPGILFLNGLLIGNPIAGGTYNFTVRVQGADGSFGDKAYSIRVMEIDPESLPDGTVSTGYSQGLSTVGSSAQITWTISFGTLPPGLTLDPSTGIISGTPTTAGVYPFTITAAET